MTSQTARACLSPSTVRLAIIIAPHQSFNKLLKPTTSLFSLPFSFFSFATSSCASLSWLLISSTPSPFFTFPSIFPNSSLKRSYKASFSALASRYNSSSFRAFLSLTRSDDSMSDESEDSELVWVVVKLESVVERLASWADRVCKEGDADGFWT